MSANYKFFNHQSCEYYPCHEMTPEKLNCLFCYCPLYVLPECEGNYQMLDKIKDCSQCTLPHHIENFDYIMKKYQELIDVFHQLKQTEKIP